MNQPRQVNEVNLTVIQGADRGRLFRRLQPPITIGREEGNSIQLNDERISRCHLKIQDDNNRLVMTDLDSTNGTKVNGQECHLRILRYGDLISLGRSVLLVGTQEEIAARIAAMRKLEDQPPTELPVDSSKRGLLDSKVMDVPTAGMLSITMGMEDPPAMPTNLSPCQSAELCELLDFMHRRIQRLVDDVEIREDDGEVILSLATWQRLLDIQARLSNLLRGISDPD